VTSISILGRLSGTSPCSRGKSPLHCHSEGPIRRPERGELMGADKNSSRRRLKLQQDELDRSDPQNHTLRTSTFRLPKPRNRWSATGPRNKHYQQPQHTRTHDSGNNSKAGCPEGGRLDWVWGEVRPPPPCNQEYLRNTSSEHQNAPRFHQQRSLVRAMLATRKSWRKPKLHPGA
jgi:hypothetical protein